MSTYDSRRPDLRGNSQDRRRRKTWLLSLGDGKSVPCHWCGKRLTRSTVESDRHPIKGEDGGRYTRDNIVPACRSCNASDKGR